MSEEANALYWILAVIVVVVVVALVLQNVRQSGAGAPGAAPRLPYKKVRSVFSPAERQFYEALKRAVGNEYVIFSKMRMSDLLWIEAQGAERASARGRVSQKHVDFILLTPDTMSPALVIELDDSSHQRPDRRQRDELVDAIFGRAGLPILHVPVRREWAPEELKGAIRKALGGSEPTPAQGARRQGGG